MTDASLPLLPAVAHLERDGAVATITLDRADSLNAIDHTMAKALARLGEEVAADSRIRVLVLRGAGSGFCAGGDIQFFARNLETIDPVIRALLTDLHRFLSQLREMPQLVLTSIHGAVAGAGFSMAFMGDFCIAADTARLRPAYAGLGVSPDAGGTIGVVDAVGPRRALQIFLGADDLSLAEARSMGLITHIVPAADLERETTVLARRLAETSGEVIAATKALIRRRVAGNLAGQLEAEMEQLIGCMGRDEFRDRVRLFASGRGAGA
ncbi:MAG: enoyl-CoA hydratase/isomerase family protein [Bradyrhizobium sp.]|nr:enoyl-CoA hydratase/isomerase family protein [Bradyrhizobium sp.]